MNIVAEIKGNTLDMYSIVISDSISCLIVLNWVQILRLQNVWAYAIDSATPRYPRISNT